METLVTMIVLLGVFGFLLWGLVMFARGCANPTSSSMSRSRRTSRESNHWRLSSGTDAVAVGAVVAYEGFVESCFVSQDDKNAADEQSQSGECDGEASAVDEKDSGYCDGAGDSDDSSSDSGSCHSDSSSSD